MTVASGIEMIGSGAASAPIQGKAQGAKRGAEEAGGAAQSFSPSAVAGTESFRAGWQSLLASLGFGAEVLSGSEAAAGQEATSPGTALAEAAGKSSRITSMPAAGASPLLRQEYEKGSAEEKGSAATGVAPKLSLAELRSQAATAQPASGSTKQAATKEEKKAATELARDSTGASDATQSTNATASANPQGVAAAALNPEAASAAAGMSLSQAVPVVMAASPVTPATEAKEQSAGSTLSTALPVDPQTALASASLSSPSRSSEPQSKAGGTEHAPAQESVQESEGSSKQRELSPVSSPSEASGSTLDATESANLEEEDALPPAAVEAENKKPLATTALGLNPARNAEPKLYSSLTSAQGESLIQPLAPTLKPAGTLTTSQNPAQTLVPGQDGSLDSASSLKPAQTVTVSQTATTSQHLTQTAAPSASATATASQNPLQTLAQISTPAPVQSGNHGMEALLAPAGGNGLNSISMAAAASDAASPSTQLTAVPPSGKPLPVSGGRSPATGTLRSERGEKSSDSLRSGSLAAAGQVPGLAMDASAAIPELAGARGAVSAAGDQAATSGPDLRETFAALDAEGAAVQPTWIHTGAQHAEAGFQDPALGWVSVRADMSGDGVHAELVAGSADAAHALGGHMEGLNSYLAEQHTPVNSLTLSSPAGGLGGSGSGYGQGGGGGQSMQQGSGQQTGQESSQSAAIGLQSISSRSVTALPAAASAPTAWSGGQDGSTQAARPGGAYISVMA
jgi:hypothetical protein